MGQLVSGLPAGSAAVATYGSRGAILFLVIGGFFIFRLTMLGLRLMEAMEAQRRESPPASDAGGLRPSLCLPVIGAVAAHLDWLYLAFGGVRRALSAVRVSLWHAHVRRVEPDAGGSRWRWRIGPFVRAARITGDSCWCSR
jgi:hypothetical protein